MGKGRIGLLLSAVALGATAPATAQALDPAFAPLNAAYQALRANDYDRAIYAFRQAIAIAPDRPAVRQDLAYTLLKTGDPEAARDQFAEAMRLDPHNEQIALEYAFLCYETKEPVTARRIFARLAEAGNLTAKEAFENVDRPLREGIARWQQAIAQAPANFSAHEELARLAEQRDELPLAAEHFEKAWRLRPDRRDLLLDLSRVWKQMGREEDSIAALVAAWRGGSPRVSEQARALLPARYPYLSEFERALALDPANSQLQSDVAFQRRTTAPAEPQRLKTRSDDTPAPAGGGAVRELGLKSFEKGYLADALRYLQVAVEADPQDSEVMLKLAWTYNMLKDDRDALRWFELARESADPAVAEEASRAYRNLAPSFARFRTTLWAYPIFSTRWNDLFGYAQMKSEVRLGSLPLRPYLSVRFIGDVRGVVKTTFVEQYLSERSTIFAAGLASAPLHGPWGTLTSWFEAGEALFYRQSPGNLGWLKPDYRGGISYRKGFGHLLAAGSHGKFAETNEDGIFVSRFGNDSLLYSQSRAGYTFRETEFFGGFHAQALWNANVTADAQRQYWANFAEMGPGVRFRFESSPASLTFSVSLLRGAYLINDYNPRRPNYNEVRVGIAYALTK